MKNDKDRHVIQRMIGYCDDIATLMGKYHGDFQVYATDISFQDSRLISGPV